jgi:hypothetical protein
MSLGSVNDEMVSYVIGSRKVCRLKICMPDGANYHTLVLSVRTGRPWN